MTTVEYVMAAKKIGDGYIYWTAISAPDYNATYAPISPSQLILPAIVDYTINSPTSGSGSLPFFNAGGDLDGYYPNPGVAKIQGIAVTTNAPLNGQVLTYVSADGYIEWRGSEDIAVTSVNTGNSPYTTLSTDYFISCDPTSGTLTINLIAAPTSGMMLQIKDATGHAASHNITVSGNGKTIDGSSSIILDQNYQNITLLYNGSTWSLL